MNILKFGFCNRTFNRECVNKIYSSYKVLKNEFQSTPRSFSTGNPKNPINPKVSNGSKSARSIKNYTIAVCVLALGATYAAVPLYRIFCQTTGYGGTTMHDLGGEKVQKLKKVTYRKIKVKFTSDVAVNMKWNFKPQQSEVVVIPGETALAFYTATNPTDKPIIGISTYNILPYAAAPYFNKIQCFCFEEQMLNPKETVDMPVFFYIDPEYCEDPFLEDVSEVILSYTFFESKEGMTLPNFFNR